MPRINLFLDSGAFGAWRRGLTIEVDKYIDFLEENKECISTYVSLDVIPGSMGQVSKTQKDLEKGAAASHKNHLHMRKKGLSPIPVFHQGEDFKWLRIMLEEGESYIGISTNKQAANPIQRAWLDQVYTLLTTNEGKPIVKTHGFGITNVNFIKKYPFFTADSTTWALMPSYGRILIPRMVKGKWNYLQADSIIISDILVTDINRFEARGDMEQDRVIDYLENEVGVTMFEARNDPEIRRYILLHFFRKFQEQIGEVHFENRRGGFNNFAQGHKPIRIERPTIIFATGTHSNLMNETLNKAKAWNRLLSYFELQSKPPEFLVKYVRDGCWKTAKNTNPKQNWDGKYRKFRTMKLIERHKRVQA